jgi:ribonuclease HI
MNQPPWIFPYWVIILVTPTSGTSLPSYPMFLLPKTLSFLSRRNHRCRQKILSFVKTLVPGRVEGKGGQHNVNNGEGRNDCHSCIWTLYFDGSKSQEGSGAGCILIDPRGRRHSLSCRLEFECTNNTTEYEALVQGLKKAIDLNVKELKVFGDSKIIIRQVRNMIHCNSPHLKNYQQEVHRLIERFEVFNITAIPRAKNTLSDSLATTASRVSPLEDYEAS